MAPDTTILLALAQMRVIGGDLRGNLLRATKMVGEAAAGGADIVLLPEAMDLGWAHHSAHESAGAIPDGEACESLAALAADHAVYLCAGITERDGRDGGIFNTAVLFDRGGRLVLRHRKINELEFARKIYRTGTGTRVCSTEFGTVGLFVCADAFIEKHSISRELGRLGAGLLLSPCAWAVPPDHDNERTPYGRLWIDCYRPVSREFKLWIAAVSCVGKLRSGDWAGHHCIGSSMLVSPAGEIVARAPFGRGAESLSLVEIPRSLR